MLQKHPEILINVENVQWDVLRVTVPCGYNSGLFGSVWLVRGNGCTALNCSMYSVTKSLVRVLAEARGCLPIAT